MNYRLIIYTLALCFIFSSISCNKSDDNTISIDYLETWIGEYEGQAIETKTLSGGGTVVESVPVEVSITRGTDAENELLVNITFTYSSQQPNTFDFLANVDQEQNKVSLLDKNFIDNEGTVRITRDFSGGEAEFSTASENLKIIMDESKSQYIIDDEKELLYTSSHLLETNVK